MKNLVLVLACLSVSSLAWAHEFEVAVIAGAPDQSLPFVNSILKERVILADSSSSDMSSYSSGIFYFGWKNSVRSAVSVEVLLPNGSTSMELIKQGIDFAAPRSAIAIVTIGRPNEALCQIFAAHPGTAFLAGLGSDGMQFDDGNMPSCSSPNILFVAGLNATLTELSPNQSWGRLARLAVPYANLENPAERRTSRSFGMAVATGKMASLLRANTELHGAALIEKFLSESTEYLPSLEGKVSGARALTNFEL